MKEHPLLLSAPMVRATLAGIKHVTRRIPSMRNTMIDGNPWGKSRCRWDDLDWPNADLVDRHLEVACVRHCYHTITPIYQPGDVVWFKETWRTDSSLDNLGPSKFCKWPVKYLADGTVLKHGSFAGNTEGKTRVSIHMPKWASRLYRPVVGSRIEYLQDITIKQAIAEGATPLPPFPASVIAPEDYLTGFRTLWDHINADRDGGIYAWSANPLVMPIEFGLENVNV